MTRKILLALFLISFPFMQASAGIMLESVLVPDFHLKNQNGKDVSISEFRSKWVVLYFYPKDMTPGCSLEAHNFQEDFDKYKIRNAVIIGISTDDTASHKAFADKEGINFNILSDPNHATIDAYKRLIKAYVGEYPPSERNTVLVSPQGLPQTIFTNVDPAKHSTQILATLDKLENLHSDAPNPADTAAEKPSDKPAVKPVSPPESPSPDKK